MSECEKLELDRERAQSTQNPIQKLPTHQEVQALIAKQVKRFDTHISARLLIVVVEDMLADDLRF